MKLAQQYAAVQVSRSFLSAREFKFVLLKKVFSHKEVFQHGSGSTIEAAKGHDKVTNTDKAIKSGKCDVKMPTRTMDVETATL